MYYNDDDDDDDDVAKRNLSSRGIQLAILLSQGMENVLPWRMAKGIVVMWVDTPPDGPSELDEPLLVDGRIRQLAEKLHTGFIFEGKEEGLVHLEQRQGGTDQNVLAPEQEQIPQPGGQTKGKAQEEGQIPLCGIDRGGNIKGLQSLMKPQHDAFHELFLYIKGLKEEGKPSGEHGPRPLPLH